MFNTLEYNKQLIKDISQSVTDVRTSQPTITFTPFIITIGDNSSSFDVCFAPVVKMNQSAGKYKEGINTQTKSLVVAVLNAGSFCFSLQGAEKYPNYVQEKLGIDGDIANHISELINYIQKLAN